MELKGEESSDTSVYVYLIIKGNKIYVSVSGLKNI